MDLDFRPHRLVLATSDTQSCVRSHCATDSVPVPHTGSSSGSIGLYNSSSGSSNGSKGSGRGDDSGVAGWGRGGEEGVGIGPVTLCGESFFTAPVAACSFREVLTPVKILRLFTKPEEMITDFFSQITDTNKVRNSSTAFILFTGNAVKCILSRSEMIDCA
jgi:hypothetical protein